MYKVGTICVGQKFFLNTERNGQECEILTGLEKRNLYYTDGSRSKGVLSQKVRWSDGHECWIPPENLRPKHYPGSWEDELFKEVLKWNPLKEKENVRV